MVKTIEWVNGTVMMLDQSRLPLEVSYIPCATYGKVAEGIQKLWIRGAPAIGIATAMGIALGAREITAGSYEDFMKGLDKVFDTLLATRPTAVNIKWAVDRVKGFLDRNRETGVARLKEMLVEESQRILDEDIRTNRAIGEWGAQFIRTGTRSLRIAMPDRLQRGATERRPPPCSFPGNRARSSALSPMRRGRSSRERD